MAGSFIVRPITRKAARILCEQHPHASTLPNSSKYYMRLDIDGRAAGLAVWGWGVQPKGTANHLFKGGVCGVKDYLELCRFFVFDWCPKNTASQFLATTHRIIKKHAPWVKWLYTYAAGFQGLIGYIYKAAGYDYLGRQECSSCIWIPGVGLVHWVAIWHRYHLPVGSGRISKKLWPQVLDVWPGAKRWSGYNFRYIYWLCNKKEKVRLLGYANFEVQPYPTEMDLEIWTTDENDDRADIDAAFAKTVPIIKLKTQRARPIGETVSHPASSGELAVQVRP